MSWHSAAGVELKHAWGARFSRHWNEGKSTIDRQASAHIYFRTWETRFLFQTFLLTYRLHEWKIITSALGQKFRKVRCPRRALQICQNARENGTEKRRYIRPLLHAFSHERCQRKIFHGERIFSRHYALTQHRRPVTSNSWNENDRPMTVAWLQAV